jgi:imidazolonepropionase-like amidohydrolase
MVEVDLAAQQRDYPASLLAYAAGKMITQTLDQGFTTVRDAGGADWGMKEAVDRYSATTLRRRPRCERCA